MIADMNCFGSDLQENSSAASWIKYQKLTYYFVLDSFFQRTGKIVSSTIHPGANNKAIVEDTIR